jgi:hypothetical protein
MKALSADSVLARLLGKLTAAAFFVIRAGLFIRNWSCSGCASFTPSGF